MKRQTKAQKCNDLGTAIMQIRNGQKVRRIGAKDGSIPTHPVVPVDKTKLEADVLSECISWLKKHRVKCDRCDSGTFQNNRGQYGTYGIIGGGDIQGMLKKHDGKHYEIETKKGKGGRLSKAQQKRKQEVEDNNGLYFVVHGIEEMFYYLGAWV